MDQADQHPQDTTPQEYTVVNLSVLDGLARPRPVDGGHRQDTWAQARARLARLPEPQRTRALAALDAMQQAAGTAEE